ncbi:family 20 glycosylhydrolase [Allokutzneria sp. A3M-2-11 16]|uniref:family 20 glycosylhydrolase n=1 Tax=Allokutzneria sp. A3M-2-11 16 TaxID=2962043 RepID=UPI0027E3072E|nr:family 20 glycosylhydrolase [Allokutzneria sp. A3M-2-11 16]
MAAAAARGHKILLSPANKVYLDMKYTVDSPIGFKWAGYLDVRDVYDWDPGSCLQGVPEESVLGVEAPLWSEHLRSFEDRHQLLPIGTDSLGVTLDLRRKVFRLWTVVST